MFEGKYWHDGWKEYSAQTTVDQVLANTEAKLRRMGPINPLAAEGQMVFVSMRDADKKGLVGSRLGAPSPRRGGRPKRYFAVNRDGIEALRRAQEDWTAMVRGLEETLGHSG